jgi:hypothetical protein
MTGNLDAYKMSTRYHTFASTTKQTVSNMSPILLAAHKPTTSHRAVIPPLAETCWAVIQRAFSDTNKSTLSPISSIVPGRWAALVKSNIGSTATFRNSGSSGMMSVSTRPGPTELTVMPRLLPNYKIKLALLAFQGGRNITSPAHTAVK